MSNSAQTSTSSRIAALLDENSFVEVGAYIAARNTDFNMTEQETPADGVVTGYGTIGGCPVSYTHLDVYKRQDLYRCRWCIHSRPKTCKGRKKAG